MTIKYKKIGEAKDKKLVAAMLEEVEKGKALLNELVSDHNKEVAELKAEIERLSSIKALIDFQSKYDINMNFQFWGNKGVSVYIEKDGINLNSFHLDTPEETIDKALKYLKRITRTE